MVKWRGVWNGYTLTRFFFGQAEYAPAERMRRILPNLGGQVQSHDVFKCTSIRTCTFLMVSPMLTTPQNSLLCQSGCMSPIKIAWGCVSMSYRLVGSSISLRSTVPQGAVPRGTVPQGAVGKAERKFLLKSIEYWSQDKVGNRVTNICPSFFMTVSDWTQIACLIISLVPIRKPLPTHG